MIKPPGSKLPAESRKDERRSRRIHSYVSDNPVAVRKRAAAAERPFKASDLKNEHFKGGYWRNKKSGRFTRIPSGA